MWDITEKKQKIKGNNLFTKLFFRKCLLGPWLGGIFGFGSKTWFLNFLQHFEMWQLILINIFVKICILLQNGDLEIKYRSHNHFFGWNYFSNFFFTRKPTKWLFNIFGSYIRSKVTTPNVNSNFGVFSIFWLQSTHPRLSRRTLGNRENPEIRKFEFTFGVVNFDLM